MGADHNIDPNKISPWESKYQDGATGWDRGGSSPVLDQWLEKMPKGRVLVPGCGRGHEISELVRAGHLVTAVDIAPSPVQHLNEQLQREGLDANVIQGFFDIIKLERLDDGLNFLHEVTSYGVNRSSNGLGPAGVYGPTGTRCLHHRKPKILQYPCRICDMLIYYLISNG